MRRGCGYSASGGSVLHNGPHPHGGHQRPNRMYHQQHQNLQPMQNQLPQLVPFGPRGPHHNSYPSPIKQSTNSNIQQQQQSSQFQPSSHQHGQHNYVGTLTGNNVSGGGGSVGFQVVGHSTSNTTNGPTSSSSSTSTPASSSNGSYPNQTSLTVGNVPSTVLGADMPPVETVVARLETACKLLHGIGKNMTKVNEIGLEIQILCEDLRRVGPLLETSYPEVLDRVMSSMRDASSQPTLQSSLRLAIFELVELRASKWSLPNDSSNYYRQRRNINDSIDLSPDIQTSHYNPPTSSSSNPSQVVRSSEFLFQNNRSLISTSPISSETSGSKTFREEIVIKNSDSGKVMGVRGRRVHIIEAISDTIISFEKVAPSNKERVLCINGCSQQSINTAKHLIHETIQRNSSPVFDGLSEGDMCTADNRDDMDRVSALKINGSKERFCYSVSLGEDVLRVTGSNLQFVQEAKFALDDHFSQKFPELFYENNEIGEESAGEGIGQLPKYDRTTLLNLSLVRTKTPKFQHLEPEIRDSIVLDVSAK